jgi:hypothetical protein
VLSEFSSLKKQTQFLATILDNNNESILHFQAGAEPQSSHQSRKANGSAGSIGGIALGKFTSLRKGKTIGKAVRERLSSSLYSSSSSGRSQQQEAEAVLVPTIPELRRNSSKPATQLRKGKQNKARSKLCALL